MNRSKASVFAILLLGAIGALALAGAALGDGSGAQVSGTVTQTGTGNPLQNVTVCVQAVAPDKGETCAATDGEGNYTITGIPAATYLVAFGVEAMPGGGRTAGQYWDGASTPAQATPIAMAPPQIFTGVNGQLGSSGAPPKHTGGGTIVVPGPQAAQPPELTPQRCKKGYRWRKVNGVKRCVPKPHHRHPHRPVAG
jgi:carboxypeptidase family protein